MRSERDTVGGTRGGAVQEEEGRRHAWINLWHGQVVCARIASNVYLKLHTGIPAVALTSCLSPPPHPHSDVLARYHPLALRWFLVSSQYRAPLNYSDKGLEVGGA